MRLIASIVLACALALPALAQDRTQTLADVRQDLSVLYVEIQQLKRELSTTGGASTGAGTGSMLDRVNAIEAELSRLTGKTEELEYRINQVVTDGTNRIGDLEFRLVELEGGDLSKLGETTTLGGVQPGPAPAAAQPVDNGGDGVQMAVGEEADYRRASEALASGDFRGAADQFAAYVQTYPGSPLEAEAQLRRGEALEGAGEMKAAAQAYLDSYSGNPGSDVASTALYKLGRALDALGQREAACQMFGQVEVRYPGSEEVAQAQSARQTLSCP
ncbi:tol-pal system protein YbgF [Mesobacterium pallidum]|uniref:tol-pal system protein YbgF n=1 Tax=Mesobacterium pallidum TaxID=2872037 RepID=UPI001EE30BC3|nr:tol-pal system protein YbgF [Mesobacterium pallidum]